MPNLIGRALAALRCASVGHMLSASRSNPAEEICLRCRMRRLIEAPTGPAFSEVFGPDGPEAKRLRRERPPRP